MTQKGPSARHLNLRCCSVFVLSLRFTECPRSRLSMESQTSVSQARKWHININFFCPVGLGTTPGLSRFHRVCPWDRSGENLGQTRVFSLFYTVEARFHRVCPWDKPGWSLGQTRGRRAAQKVYLNKVYVPFSLASL